MKKIRKRMKIASAGMPITIAPLQNTFSGWYCE